MRKIALFAVPAAVILAGIGAWAASITQARVDTPPGPGVDNIQLMMNARDLPTEHWVDYSVVFNWTATFEKPNTAAMLSRSSRGIAMLHAPARAHPVQGYKARFHAVRIADPRPKVVQLLDRAHGRKASRTSPLDRYLEGWAEANLGKILDATAPEYRFQDPFVGSFSRRALHEYFDLLQDRLSRAGAIRRPDIAFFLRGPMDWPSHLPGVQFWREAPRIGLTGVTQIEVGERGVIAESVAYDANLASDMLRCAFER
jgi:hypothetical protein